MAHESFVLLPPAGQRIMFILAHPDDADFLAGGTVARMAEEKRDIHYLFVTRGDKGGDSPDIDPKELGARREAEQREVAKVLGVQYLTFLDGYSDGEVVNTLELREKLTYHIRLWKPDTIFTFDPWRANELHSDHRAVSTCAFDSLNAARSPMYHPEQLRNGGVTAHRVKDVYFFSTDRPNHWVDISGVAAKKVEAIKLHQSQMNGFDPEGFVKRRGQVAGQPHRFKIAEDFHHYALPG